MMETERCDSLKLAENAFVKERATIEAPPEPTRNVVYLPLDDDDENASGHETFTVVSYNILADCHVDKSKDALYSKCEPGDLHVADRFQSIVRELEGFHPDVVCLQEVPPNDYQLKFLPYFNEAGFQGVFKKRVADTHEEGEATFYRTAKFDLVKSVSKSLVDLLVKRVSKENAQFGAWNYVKRPDVVLLTVLRSKESGKEVVVSNTHVNFGGYKLRDLQALQTTMVLKLTLDYALRGSKLLPHIICGDFNQQPGCPGYRLLETGSLPQESVDELTSDHKHIVQLKENATQPRTGLIHLLGAEFFSHSSPHLSSAYARCLGGVEPRVTCVDVDLDDPFQTLDYIWFSQDSLRVVSVVDVPSVDELLLEKAFPSQKFPSDHLSLCATFALTDGRSKERVSSLPTTTTTTDDPGRDSIDDPRLS